MMLASNRGTLMELGITPIITSGMVFQVRHCLPDLLRVGSLTAAFSCSPERTSSTSILI
jgi:preprotein translocase subunit SecY